MSRLEMVSSVSSQYDILHALEAMRSSTTVRRGLQNKMFTSATSRGPGAYLVGLAGFFYKDIISLLTSFSFSIAIASAHDAEVARPMNDACIQQEASSFKRDVIGEGSLYRRTPSCAVKMAARGEARVLYWAIVEINV